MFKPSQETIVATMTGLMKNAFVEGQPTITIEMVVSGFEDKENRLFPLVEKQVDMVKEGKLPTAVSLEVAVDEAFPDVIKARRVSIVNELITFINGLFSSATRPGWKVLEYIKPLTVSSIDALLKGDVIAELILDDAHLKGFGKEVMATRIANTRAMLLEVFQETVANQYNEALFKGNGVPDYISTRAFSAAKGADTEPFNENLREYMTDFFLNFAETAYRQLTAERHKFMKSHSAPVRKPKPAPKYTQYMTLGIEAQNKLHSFLGSNSPEALVIAQREDGSIDFLVNCASED